MTVVDDRISSLDFQLEVTHDGSGPALAVATRSAVEAEAERLGVPGEVLTTYDSISVATADEWASGYVSVSLRWQPVIWLRTGLSPIDTHLRAEAIAAVHAANDQAVVWGIG